MEAPKHKSPGLDDTTAKEVCFSLFISFMLDLWVVQLIVTIALCETNAIPSNMGETDSSSQIAFKVRFN